MKKISKAIQIKYINKAMKLAKEIEKQYMLLDGRDDIYSNELKITTGLIKKRLASEVISQIKLNYK